MTPHNGREPLWVYLRGVSLCLLVISIVLAILLWFGSSVLGMDSQLIAVGEIAGGAAIYGALGTFLLSEVFKLAAGNFS